MASVPSIPPVIQQTAKLALTKTDNLLNRLTRMLKTVAGADKLLLTLYYLLKLVHPQLSRLRIHRQRRPLTIALLRKGAVGLLPSETLIQVIGQNSRLAACEASTKALADAISEYRLFTRLWGLLGIYAWAKTTYNSPPPDATVRALVWAQIVVGTGFQAYENLAFLALKGVLGAGPAVQRRWWLVSCRFWAAHLVLEAVKLLRQSQIEQDEQEIRDSKDKVVDPETISAWRRAWYSNAVYVPVAMHYSLADGLLTDEQQGIFGLVAGGIGLRKLWQQTV